MFKEKTKHYDQKKGKKSLLRRELNPGPSTVRSMHNQLCHDS